MWILFDCDIQKDLNRTESKTEVCGVFTSYKEGVKHLTHRKYVLSYCKSNHLYADEEWYTPSFNRNEDGVLMVCVEAGKWVPLDE